MCCNLQKRRIYISREKKSFFNRKNLPFIEHIIRMRNLQKTLQALAAPTVMEYCPIFGEIKSVLEYCNKTVKPFNKLHFRSGNDAYIEEISLMLQQVLIKADLIHAETFEPLANGAGTLRRVLMFLLANTDCTYKYNLRDDTNLVHVLEMCPLLPKFLLVEIVWQLKLDAYFFEVLAYTPIWFGFQYVDIAVESLKHTSDPYVVLTRVKEVMGAIMVSMARSEMRQIDSIDQKIIYTKLENSAMNLLRQFHTPDAQKFENFERDEWFRYFGFAMRHLLQMVLHAFDLFERPVEASAPQLEDIEIYEICTSKCAKISQSPAAILSVTLQEAQKKIITAMLNSLQNNVLLLTLKVFIYWVEIDCDDGRNLQQIIGELAHRIMERIEANANLQHNVQAQLRIIAIRPKTLDETISEATNGEILRSLDQELPDDTKRLWLDELFNRMDSYGNSECVESMQAHANLLTHKHCVQVMEFIKLENERIKKEATQTMDTNDNHSERDNTDANEDTVDDEELFDPLRVLLQATLQHFTTKDVLKVLGKKLELFGEKQHHQEQLIEFSFAIRENFDQRLTEFFNRLMLGFDMRQFLCFCFEDATTAWRKFFESACHNEQHIKHFCETARETQPYSNIYVQQLLSNAMTLSSNEMEENGIQKQLKYFPQLLCEIYFVLYHPGHKMVFLKSFINQHVNALLTAQAHSTLLLIVRAMNLISSRGETQSFKPLHFDEITAPVLVMIARIMDKCRWDLITYTDVRDELVRECIQFIQNNVKKFLPVATAKDRKWMSKVVKDSFRPLTQYYFQRFSLTPTQAPLHFDQFLLQKEIEEHSEAEMFLIIHYVRCTMKETEWLAQSPRLLMHISNVMLTLGGVVNETSTPNSINNYRHCLTNYANIVKKFLLPKAQNDDKQVEKLLMKILRIIAITPTTIYNDIFISFEPLLLETYTKLSQPWHNEMIKEVQLFTSNMPECRGKDIFLKKFNESVQATIDAAVNNESC